MDSMIDINKDYVSIGHCNIDHVVALIMLEHILVFTNTFEGYVIRVSHFNKRERWEITVDTKTVVIYFFPHDNYSQRVSIISEAIDSLKTGDKRRNNTLFKDLANEAIAYRDRIKLRWGSFTASVKPVDEDLRWFIRYGNHSITFFSSPDDDDELDLVCIRFISFITDVDNGK